MDCGGLDTRWWNLSAGVLAMSVVGCGPSIFLESGDTEADTGGESGPMVDEGVLPGTGGPIACDTDDQCPDGLVCIDNTCRVGNDDVAEYSDYSEYSEYSEYSDYSDYVDYAEYKDYSDYLDVNYCYEYGPFGQCCDYEPCPEYCYGNDDCFVGQLCEPGEYINPTCNYVPFLSECDTLPTMIPVDVEGLPDEVISLSFVQADDDVAEELLVGFGGGGASVIDSATAMITPLPLDAGTLIADATSADFDGDTDSDLVLAADSGVTLFLANDGAGGFEAPVDLGMLGNVAEVEALQFDGDGFMDIAVRLDDGMMFVYLGDGMGTFPASVLLSVPFGDPVISFALTEFDLNPQDDLFVLTLNTDYGFNGAEMQPEVLDPVGVDALPNPVGFRLVESADFDGDGLNAVVATTAIDNWSLVETVRPQGSTRMSIFAEGRSIGLSDLDGDLVPDLVLADPSLLYVRGEATGGPSIFECVGLLDISVDAPFAEVGDFDGNGLGDIALSDGTELVVHESQ